MLTALPYLAADDPVDAAYVMLAVNLVLFAAVVTCLAKALLGDHALLAGWPRRTEILAAGAFFALLPNMVAHVPILLGDLPSLAAFMGAVLIAVRGASGHAGGPPLLRRYAIAGFLCALATLLKVTYLAYGLVLLAAMLALDGTARAARARCAAAFLAGMAPAALQVLSVFLHTGQLGLYDREYMQRFFSYPRRELGIESVIFTIPEPGVHLTQVAGGISRLEVAVLRLFRGVFGFEWAVYLGTPSRGPVWTLAAFERIRAWVLVAAYFAFSARIAMTASPSLRMVNLVAAGGALVTAVLMHTELRYYALPRSVLWLTAALTLLAASPRLAGGWRSAPPTS